MVNRITLYAAALLLCTFPAIALAEDAPKASLSGPANGTNVAPSAAVQKEPIPAQREGRSVFYRPKVLPFGIFGAALAAGAPGVEGGPGTQSGR